MPDSPSPERDIDDDLVATLLAASLPHLAGLPRTRAAEGWDCVVWRVGTDLAVRVPRRAVAAPLVRHEQRVLPLVGPAIEATGLRVPTPLLAGDPTGDFPWPWSLVPWFDGSRGLDAPRHARRDWAAPLAAGLRALHVPATPDHPRNPFRGVPLRARRRTVDARFDELTPSTAGLAPAVTAWREGLQATPWLRAPVWIHGDLHPGNLIADGGGLRAVIDFGDVTAGDPAYDLATAWLTFDTEGRRAFRTALEDDYDPDTWTRARAWAAAIAVLLVAQSDDSPAYRALGTETLHELSID